MTTSLEKIDAPDAPASVSRALWIALLAVFGLLYAYDVWTALQNLLSVPDLVTRNYDFYRANGLTGLIKPVPWVQLVVAVVAPIAAYAVAVRLSRGRVLWQRAVLFLVGWSAVSAIGASVAAYVSTRYGL